MSGLAYKQVCLVWLELVRPTQSEAVAAAFCWVLFPMNTSPVMRLTCNLLCWVGAPLSGTYTAIQGNYLSLRFPAMQMHCKIHLFTQAFSIL